MTPMFPLGLVLFPGVSLPLQVFEPRYRQLTVDCLDGDREFGVVLIERGSEVGGGDTRFDVCTVARIIDARFDERGLVRLDTVGMRRARVVRWLPDDPYPRAETAELDPLVVTPSTVASLRAAEAAVARAHALRRELALPAMPFPVTLDPDPGVALFQLAALAPLGPLDQQRLLSASSAEGLVEALATMLEDEIAVLEARRTHD